MQARQLRPRQRVRLCLRSGEQVAGVVCSIREGRLRLRSRHHRDTRVIPLSAIQTVRE